MGAAVGAVVGSAQAPAIVKPYAPRSSEGHSKGVCLRLLRRGRVAAPQRRMVVYRFRSFAASQAPGSTEWCVSTTLLAMNRCVSGK